MIIVVCLLNPLRLLSLLKQVPLIWVKMEQPLAFLSLLLSPFIITSYPFLHFIHVSCLTCLFTVSSYHDGEHYNSVRLKEDSCIGPASPIIIKVYSTSFFSFYYDRISNVPSVTTN